MNWHPITLLNISYKIYAKALQLRLQPVLMEIISSEQSAFLPLRFILDNIMLKQETIAWAERSGQDLLFLKLDSPKHTTWSIGVSFLNPWEHWDSQVSLLT
jgi:hypothetical protein